jgi:hypothetical protein
MKKFIDVIRSSNYRVFFLKDNGQVFECFENKENEPFDSKELTDIMMNNRKKVVNYIGLAESQLNFFLDAVKVEENRKFMTNYTDTAELYYTFGIISKEQYEAILQYKVKHIVKAIKIIPKDGDYEIGFEEIEGNMDCIGKAVGGYVKAVALGELLLISDQDRAVESLENVKDFCYIFRAGKEFLVDSVNPEDFIYVQKVMSKNTQ